MVGGGKDAFIGAIHRIAANMDGLIELGSRSARVSIPKLRTNPEKCCSCPEDRTIHSIMRI